MPPPIFGITLKLDVRQLSGSAAEIPFSFSVTDLPESLNELRLKGELQGEFLVSASESGSYVVTIRLSGVRVLVCSRSSEEFDYNFKSEFSVIIEKTSASSQELVEDDEDYRIKIGHSEKEIDFSECLRQQLILEQPINPIANPQKGIGWKDEIKEESDPRWDKLKELKNKLNK
jgi:uncharacterized protein